MIAFIKRLILRNARRARLEGRNALLQPACTTAVAIVAVLAAGPAGAADPDGLWKLVHEHCVPNQEQHGLPAPCALVDLAGGADHGFVVLKDLIGATQYLVMPTAKITGIEDAKLLAPDTPNYFADAWRERSYTVAAAKHPLPRDALSLAVNSPYARSQNQLHIHIDCLRADVREALRRAQPQIGDKWAPFPAPLLGHHYMAMRVAGDDLSLDPFRTLAAAVKPDTMGRQTLVVAGAELPDGQPGFIILADHVDAATRDRAGGEELQDHDCALARQ